MIYFFIIFFHHIFEVFKGREKLWHHVCNRHLIYDACNLGKNCTGLFHKNLNFKQTERTNKMK